MNAVDILASRVVPFFERQGNGIKEIHTRKTSEYCGFPPCIRLKLSSPLLTSNTCQWTSPATPTNSLRAILQFSAEGVFSAGSPENIFDCRLDELQKDLDAFVEAYNAMQMNHKNEMKASPTLREFPC